jgi:hypothetical protein
MPRPKIDFDTVRKLARQVGDVEDASTHGSLALKAQGKLLAWSPIHKSVEPDSLAVRIELGERAELIAAAPEVYYLTDHYLNYPTVLVRLSRIHPDALKDLLRMAWSSCATAKSSDKRRPTKRG